MSVCCLSVSNSLLPPQLLEHGRYSISAEYTIKMNEEILSITQYKADINLQLVADKPKILIPELIFSPGSCLASPEEMRPREVK